MSMLIQALLHYSQLGKKADAVLVDCNVLVKAVVEDLNNLIETTGAKIEVAELPTLKVYSVELRQLFQNLLINAIKFSRKGVAPQLKLLLPPKITIGFLLCTITA
jgi:light-regulated signal transduction histidine kinase (bacteriophytochrome)